MSKQFTVSVTDSYNDTLRVEEYDTSDQSILVTVVGNGKPERNVMVERENVERLYNALGDYLYGNLDEYDAEAIAAANAKKEAILDQVANLIGYERPPKNNGYPPQMSGFLG